MTQLTLQLDDELVHRAQVYSVQTGRPLADLVAGYLASLTTEPARPTVIAQDPSESSDSLAQRQYRLADQYPGQFVVLVGERVIHHSADRAEAGRAYDQAFEDDPSATPVMVDPTLPRHRRPKPIVRGRALIRRRRA